MLSSVWLLTSYFAVSTIPDKQGEYKGAHYEIREVQLDTGKDNYETREIELNYNIWYKFVD